MGVHVMKESGIAWIGKIPLSWEISKFKYEGTPRHGLTYSPSDLVDDGVSVLRAMNIQNGKLVFNQTVSVSKEKARKCLLHRGDLLVCSCNGSAKLVGKNAFVEDHNQYSYGSFMMAYSSNLDKFGYWVLNSGLFDYYLPLFFTTTINQLTTRTFGQMEFALPPIRERNAIANFLDTKCAEIDSLASDIEKQIETLQEYKKSVITEAVTKGLDPNVEMKDSGVEWIGNIPQHWKVVPLKYLGLVRNGLTYKPTDLLDEGVPVLRSTNIQNGRLDLTDVVYVNNKLAQQHMLKKGDILVCSRNGSAKLIGKNAYIGESNSYAFGAFMMVFSSKLGEYGYYLLNSALFPYYKPLFTTSTINQLTGKQFGEMKVPLAPEFERQIITKYLKEQVSCIEVSIEEKQKQLEVLAQYKQSLIYEYVTGKKAVPM